MYWMILASSSPLRSISRTWRRRSCARSAFESAMVWFWQTRQRNSDAMRVMRASRAGSSAAGAASLAKAGRARHSHAIQMKRSLRIQLLQHRLDALADHLGRQRPDVLQADYALLVDEEGLGHAVDAEVDA